MAIKNMGDYDQQLEDLADCHNYKFLVYASTIPSSFREFRWTPLEYDSIIHHL